MVKKTVLKVDTSCFKCKKKLLKAVSSLEGVDKIEVDEAKRTLTITGKADPYDIIVNTRKVAKYVEVVSIGDPPPPPKKPEEKKPEEKKSDEKKIEQTKSDEKKSDEKKSDEKKSDEKKIEQTKSDEKKSDEKKTEQTKPAPMGPVYWPYYYYPPNQPVAVVCCKDEPNPACTIM